MKLDRRKLLILGQNVRRLRKEMGLSQEALAAAASFDRTYISMIERGVRNPSLLNVCSLANALNVGICELLEGL